MGKPKFRCNVATSFGTLTKESFKMMDEAMQVAIGYTLQRLVNVQQSDWKAIIYFMNQNKLLTVKSGSTVDHSDSMTRKGTGVFKTDGSPSQEMVNNIRNWFNKLVSDSDVLADTDLDIDSIARMVASTGAKVDSAGSIFHKSVHYSKDVLDVSILKFPDIDRPYFKVYSIYVMAWRDCDRTLFVQKDNSGVRGQFREVSYDLDTDQIAKLNPAVSKQAVKEAENLFGDDDE